MPLFLRGFVLILMTMLVHAGVAAAADAPASGVEVAVSLPLTGDESAYGQAGMEEGRLAREEANAGGEGPRISVKEYDDRGDNDTAKQIAGRIVASRAALVLGPAFSKNSLVAGPVYAGGGIVSLA